ncbi:unnamed protein product [Cunninghamella blakesleeana]
MTTTTLNRNNLINDNNCAGCLTPINGSVISFGNSLFHSSCFTCAKCHQHVENQQNLLILTDGRPICKNCSYRCKLCGTHIDNEAIVTGNDTYHVECFRCILCKKNIDDLIYTQTSKGIYCTTCYKKCKNHNGFTDRPLPAIPSPIENVTQTQQLRYSIKNSNFNHQLTSSSSSSTSSSISSSSSSSPIPSPTTSSSIQMMKFSNVLGSSSISSSINMDRKSKLSNSNDSTDLSSTLSTSLSFNYKNSNITNSKFNCASNLLQFSLDNLPSTNKTTTTNNIDITNINDIDELKRLLKQTTDKLKTTETSFTKLKSASEKALDEFTKAKEEFAKEIASKQQQEYTIIQLKQELSSLQKSSLTSSSSSASISSSSKTAETSSIKEGEKPKEKSLLAEKEIDRLASVKVELERSCNKLKEYRDSLAYEIDEKINKQQQTQAGLESSVENKNILEKQILGLKEHIDSLKKERDGLKNETEELNKSRDDVIHEMVLLNTKIAELSSLNNDLSRRMTEREREAAAVMAGTSFLNHAPSPSPSTELLSCSPVSMQRKGSEASIIMQRVTSKDSTSSKDSSSKMFKLKKPKSVFTKLSNYNPSSHKKDRSISPSNSNHHIYNNQDNYSIYNLNSNSSFNIIGEMMRKDSKQSCDTTGGVAHNFIQTSVLRSVKCIGCGEKFWGSNEYKCQHCGSYAHLKCMTNIPTFCYETSSSLELASPTDSVVSKQDNIFGTDLTARVAIEERDIPILVERCIEAVEARGMDYEGIYRKSGGAAQMRSIQMSFETNEPLDLKDEDTINDICAVTSVLKQYFRELPNPLLPYELYDQFMDAVRLTGQPKLDRFIELTSQLPKPNYDTLKLLMTHLDNVQKQSVQNLMTTKNLAMVFGPTLMKDKDASRDLLDMSYKNATVEFIINNVNDLFN